MYHQKDIIINLRKIYDKYGDINSLKRVNAYILNGSVLRVRNVSYRKSRAFDKVNNLNVPVSKVIDNDIVFFSPNLNELKKMDLKTLTKDTLTIYKLINELIQSAS